MEELPQQGFPAVGFVLPAPWNSVVHLLGWRCAQSADYLTEKPARNLPQQETEFEPVILELSEEVPYIHESQNNPEPECWDDSSDSS